jgi:glycosyltransferase involved in cell wall biosynthesis
VSVGISTLNEAVLERSAYTGPERRRSPTALLKLRDDEAPDISVVMPCLNESRSVGLCVEKAWAGIRASGLRGEVIVADNGSTDGSVEVARAKGAQVVYQPAPGYGNAYLRGFAEARGRIIVMGDSDSSYDFAAIPQLIEPLLAGGCDYVLGSRFGGTIEPGAMTWSHRYIGNPVLTAVLNLLFDLEVSDAHSGLRAFTRPALDRMALRCEGMECASEIVVKAARAGLRVAEVPIVYHPRIGESKLKSVHDGWRHLRFLLTLSPTLLFLLPGALLLAGSLLAEVGLAFAGGGTQTLWGKVGCALIAILGSCLVTGGLFARTYSLRFGFEQPGRLSNWLDRAFSLDCGLLTGGGLTAVGMALVALQFVVGWGSASTDSASASEAIMAPLLVILGLQVCVGSFVLNIFQVLPHAPTSPEPMTIGTPAAPAEAWSAATGEAP